MRRLALAALAAIAIAAACLLLFKLPGAELPEAGRSPVAAAYELRLEAGEGGELLVNGSAAGGAVISGKPFTALVEAAPSRCYALKQLLVNGSPVEGSRAVLRVAGNTTVSAAFERSKVRVSLESNVEGAALLLGGSAVTLPATVEVLCGSTVQLAASAGKGWRVKRLLVNGSPAPSEAELIIAGDTTVRLELEREPVQLRVSNPANLTLLVESVSSTGEVLASWQLTSSAELSFPNGTKIKVTGFCEQLNETHYLCFAYAIAKGTFELLGAAANRTILLWNTSTSLDPVAGDVELAALPIVMHTNLTAPLIEVWINGTLQPLTIYWGWGKPVGRVEYLGGGTIRAVGELNFYIPVPPNASTVIVEGVAYMPVQGTQVCFGRIASVIQEGPYTFHTAIYRGPLFPWDNGKKFRIVFKGNHPVEAINARDEVIYDTLYDPNVQIGWLRVRLFGAEVTFTVYVLP